MNLLRRVHRWLGLALALLLMLVASSGGLLLLRDPYYRAKYPQLAAPVGADVREARAEVLTRIEARWQGEGIQLVKFPGRGINAFHVWLRDGTEALVDSRTGTVIDAWHWSERLPAFLFELHAHLLADPEGSLVNGMAALLLVFMALTGVVLWWPLRRSSFRFDAVLPRRLSPAALLRSHAATGALAAAPILLFAATGAAIVFYDPTAQIMSRWFDGRAPQLPDAHVSPQRGSQRPWTDLLRQLDRTFADGEAVFYYPGTADNARLMFRKRLPGEWHPNGRSYVVIDPYSASVLQAVDARAQGAGTRFMYAIYPIHAAKVGGWGMVAVAAFAAIALTWVAAGGTWVYVSRWRARPRRLTSLVETSRPSER